MKKLDELKISPAPWVVSTKGVPRCILANNGIVAEGIDDANARLIAAAPDCYDALQRIVSATEGSVMDFPRWQRDLQKALDDAKKALVKAGGGND